MNGNIDGQHHSDDKLLVTSINGKNFHLDKHQQQYAQQQLLLQQQQLLQQQKVAAHFISTNSSGYPAVTSNMGSIGTKIKVGSTVQPQMGRMGVNSQRPQSALSSNRDNNVGHSVTFSDIYDTNQAAHKLHFGSTYVPNNHAVTQPPSGNAYNINPLLNRLSSSSATPYQNPGNGSRNCIQFLSSSGPSYTYTYVIFLLFI